MSGDPTFDDLMARLRTGDGAAARVVYQRYAARLLALARTRLPGILRQKVDPEDVLQSAYRSFFVRQADGQLDPESWEHLWFLLTTIVVRKCGRRAEYFHAACRDVGREVPLPSAREGEALSGPGEEPTPSQAAQLAEVVEHLLRGMREREREMLTLSLEGFTPHEISARVGRSERTVQRVLKRVRALLEELRDADPAGP